MGVDWNSFLEGLTTALSLQNIIFIIHLRIPFIKNNKAPKNNTVEIKNPMRSNNNV